MESCKEGHNRWFVNREWSMADQDAIYRVVCKSCGETGPSARGEDNAIEFWNNYHNPRFITHTKWFELITGKNKSQE